MLESVEHIEEARDVVHINRTVTLNYCTVMLTSNAVPRRATSTSSASVRLDPPDTHLGPSETILTTGAPPKGVYIAGPSKGCLFIAPSIAVKGCP